MSYLAAHPMRVLACLIATACGAHAEEATNATPMADQSKITVGATLMSDYIYRGSSWHKRQRAIGKRQSACFPSMIRAFSSECCIHE
jgi:hypothetical protein